MRIDPRKLLPQLVDDLAYSYRGVFEVADIERAVDHAWSLLAGGSTVPDYLPILVARQAREQLMAIAQAEGRVAKKVPGVLFVCVHNAGRSQMAAADPAGQSIEVVRDIRDDLQASVTTLLREILD